MSAAPTPEWTEALQLLREIRDDVRSIGATLNRQVRRPQPLSASDQSALETLVPTIIAAVGDRTFTVRELFQHADLTIPAAVALRKALTSIGSTKKVGRLLHRGEGLDISGLEIVSNGRTDHGVLRTVVRYRQESK